MGYNVIKAKSVPRRADFVKAKKTTVVSASGSTNTSTDIIVQSGENLTAGDLVMIYTDGKAWKSTSLYKDGVYAQYFVTNTVTAGYDAILRRYGQIEIATSSMTIGVPIYLTTGTPNYTQTVPTKTATTDILQYVGYASDVGTIVIDIQKPCQYV